MTQPWPSDPTEKANKLKELHKKYHCIFVGRSTKTIGADNINPSDPTLQKAEDDIIHDHHIRKITCPSITKDIQQLKQEAQYR
ncbi:unnamed protein product [Macrosiphum euphorbiae]|uniref:Uncharacterized protein n=1 Tax=Macrosiphum euphorbiae TaxID=13131 RepID=A0AAV0XMC4_9HEMI|nr:unnamed protein product [Macrosiphum euphorbiae]